MNFALACGVALGVATHATFGAIQPTVDRLALELSSEAGQACVAGPVTTGFTPAAGGFSGWSSPLVTGEWSASVQTCLRARIFAVTRKTQIKLNLKSEWRSDCETSLVASGMTGHSGTSRWSSPMVTSLWDGAPWSCLSVQLETSAGSWYECRFFMETIWSGQCKKGTVTSGQVQLFPHFYTSTEWTPWLVTSEWNDGPWSCLRARMACAPVY